MNDLGLGEFLDRDTVRFTRDYPHSTQRVWPAISEAEQMSTWYLPCTMLEPKVGGRWSFETNGKSWRGHIREFDPPRLIDFGGWLRFELIEIQNGCRLVLTIKRAATGWSPMALAGYHGWFGRLARLVNGVSNEEAEQWASEQYAWEGLFLVYERVLRHQLANGAQPIYRIHFEPNLCALDSESTKHLDDLVRILREKSSLRVNIDGFGADPVSMEQSVELAKDRMSAVGAYLAKAGIEPARVDMGFALGNYHELVPNDTEAGRAFNRRVEVRPIY